MAHSLILGGRGGIGAALAAVLRQRGDQVTALARQPLAPNDPPFDIGEPASIAAAAGALGDRRFDLIIVATGILHDESMRPERSLRDLDAAELERSLRINLVGPALALKHFTPLLAREGRPVIAALSARVGSISDNRLGGWHAYRAAKAGLNQIIRTSAIEFGRTRPERICVGLHPGTVDTPMSRPFQANVPPGQLLTPDQSASALVKVIDGLTAEDSGHCLDWRGERIAP